MEERLYDVETAFFCFLWQPLKGRFGHALVPSFKKQ